MTDGGAREAGIEMFDRWTALWNRDVRLAERIMAPRFVLRYAQAGGAVFDEIRTPQRLAEIIDGWHRDRPGLRFTAEGEAVVDGTHGDGGFGGLVARPYVAGFTGAPARSGTDILRVADGRITEVWSVSSGADGRTFYR
jgi:hypothetical protein